MTTHESTKNLSLTDEQDAQDDVQGYMFTHGHGGSTGPYNPFPPYGPWQPLPLPRPQMPLPYA